MVGQRNAVDISMNIIIDLVSSADFIYFFILKYIYY